MANEHHFRITVLGRYPARLKGNEPAVTLNLAAGTAGHLNYAGTLTMTEAEYGTLVEALRSSLGDAFELDEH